MTETLANIVEKALAAKPVNARHLIAITGAPASGKSYLAIEMLSAIQSIGLSASIVPMDGFHLDDSILKAQGQLHRKGAEHTFDSQGFLACVKRIHDAGETVYVPVFDRDREIAIAGAQAVQPSDEVVLFEGNYLLLNKAPWSQLEPLFTSSLFIDPGLDVIEQRLLERWRGFGYDEAEVKRRTYENDLPNAEFVSKNSFLENSIALSGWS